VDPRSLRGAENSDRVRGDSEEGSRRSLGVDFRNGREAYKGISTFHLIRAYVVFKACSIRWVVDNSDTLLNYAQKMLGTRLLSSLLKPTLFGHFCGGEDLEGIKPTIQRLNSAGIGGILDYAAEADVEEDESTHADTEMVFARQYSSHTEKECDARQQIFETAIRAVHGVSPDGFAAIKVTALGNPILLERWSNSIKECLKLFERIDVNQDGMVSFAEFRDKWVELLEPGKEKLIEETFAKFDCNETGMIDPVAWLTFFEPAEMRKLANHCKQHGSFTGSLLDDQEEDLLHRMRERFDSIVALADSLNVRLMVDAEHSYFQPAIDSLVLQAQRKYNKTTPRVYGTIQCYLKDARTRNSRFMRRAELEGWVYAVKIVRGAYMHQERAKAVKEGYEDPIHSTLEDTHMCYHQVMEDVIERPKVKKGQESANMVIASHNQQSIEHAIRLIQKAGFEAKESGVAFGQLLGMADHLSYTLGAAGYNAYKYIPYGPVLECLPYLIRRAQENSDLMGSVGHETKMLREEIFRRALSR